MKTFPDVRIVNEINNGITIDNRVVKISKVIFVPISINNKSTVIKLIILEKSSDNITIGIDLFDYLNISFDTIDKIVRIGRYNITSPLIVEGYNIENAYVVFSSFSELIYSDVGESTKNIPGQAMDIQGSEQGRLGEKEL